MAQSALEKGQQFLKENGKKEGVTTTASGLQYKVLREGTGKQPRTTDVVEVHYEGRLIEGTVFDSSYARRETIEFPLDGVIAGWTEGVALMKEGAKYQLYIPSELAYGSHGAGGDIGPDETLIFDVELIKIA
jgi:FKBP-type peptidyl-prolyl cis-trans isomerase